VYEEVYQSSRTQDGAISAYLLNEDIIPPNKDPNPIRKEINYHMQVVIYFALKQVFTTICLMRI
jgi:hypothetical protein